MCHFFYVKVNEWFPFSIALSWKGSAPDAQNGGTENQQSTIVFPKGNVIPSIKALTFQGAVSSFWHSHHVARPKMSVAQAERAP